MIINLAAVARAVPLTAILLGACVSQRAYDQLQAQNQQPSNDTPQGRAANRRIEITIQGPGAPAA